jgi:hypothetical protein
MSSRTATPTRGPRVPRAASATTGRRTPRSEVRRRRLGCLGSLLFSVVAFLGLGFAIMTGASSLGGGLTDPIESGPADISGIPEADAVPWKADQPTYGVDVSFPQCGRTLRDMDAGFAIIGLDGGMPNRANPCFAAQWRFASRQAGAAVYVNTADNNKGDPLKVGRRAAEGDLEALAEQGVPAGTPVWLDVELPEVWKGSQARHRAVITEHLRVLAEAGYPVGIYSAPSLWEEITGGAAIEVPTWVGIGTATAERAAATCGRVTFGDRKPAIVQRIGTGSDGRSLDRNLTCPGTDLTGLVRPT